MSLLHQEICALFYDISLIAKWRCRYPPNSFIVRGSELLGEMITRTPFPEETVHRIAKSMLTDEYYTRLLDEIFDRKLLRQVNQLIAKLANFYENYTPEFEGISNTQFERVFTTPYDEFITFYPNNNIEAIDDFDNESHQEILAQEGALEDSEDDSDDDLPDLDYDTDNDDFIDPENSPEYAQYSEPPPRYEERNRDRLLDAGIPLYSEFSWVRTMLYRMESLA
jgi:hypothetical protein